MRFLWLSSCKLKDQACQDVARALPHMVLEVINNDEDVVEDIGILYMSFDSSTTQNVKHDDSIGNNTLASNSSISCSLNRLTKENTYTGNVEGETVDKLSKSCNSSGSQCSLPNERKLLSSELNTCDIECEATTPPIPALENDSFYNNDNTCSLNITSASKVDTLSLYESLGYGPDDLEECVAVLHDLYLSRRVASLKVVRDKYKQNKFNSSQLTPTHDAYTNSYDQSANTDARKTSGNNSATLGMPDIEIKSSGDGSQKMDFRDTYFENKTSFPTGRQNWNMEFKDAAESVDHATMAGKQL
ncbi:unnamed protein product [Vicia faba]|uniref:Cyclin C-terminal domain-containing protein n=1 Tax=Vicia faba TaxID=3906 RepID=A0AAV0ZXZ0_VICFA|nr:unnamed protein product [Vicia faba]